MSHPEEINAPTHVSDPGGLDARVDQLIRTPQHSTSKRLAALGIATLAGLGAVGYLSGGNEITSPGHADVAAPANPGDNTPTPEVNNAEYDANFNSDLAKYFPGFSRDQLRIGSEVDWSVHQEQRGHNAFTTHTVKSGAEYAAFLKSDSPQAKALLQRIENSNASEQDKEEALNGQNFILIQPTVASEAIDNSYFVNGKAVDGAPIEHKANDVYLMKLASSGHMLPDLSTRADCGNIHVKEVVPAAPKVVVTTPTTQRHEVTSVVPVTEVTTTTTPNTVPPTTRTTTTTPPTTQHTVPPTTEHTVPPTTEHTVPPTTTIPIPNKHPGQDVNNGTGPNNDPGAGGHEGGPGTTRVNPPQTPSTKPETQPTPTTGAPRPVAPPRSVTTQVPEGTGPGQDNHDQPPPSDVAAFYKPVEKDHNIRNIALGGEAVLGMGTIVVAARRKQQARKA